MAYNTTNMLRDAAGFVIPQYYDPVNDVYKEKTNVIVKEYFSGSTTTPHTFTAGTMTELVVMNDGSSDITVTVGSITMTVKSNEGIDEKFAPFTSCTITSSGSAFRAYGRG